MNDYGIGLIALSEPIFRIDEKAFGLLRLDLIPQGIAYIRGFFYAIRRHKFADGKRFLTVSVPITKEAFEQALAIMVNKILDIPVLTVADDE